MSQQIRRFFVALGLTAALLLAGPAPSRAAGFRDAATTVPDFTSRLWSWLESLLPGPAGAAAPRPRAAGKAPAGPVRWAAASTTTTTTTDQGSMIDPNGHK